MISRHTLNYILAVATAACVSSMPGQAEFERVRSERAESTSVHDRVVETDFDMRAFRARLYDALELSEEQVVQLRELRAQLQLRLGDARQEAREGNLTRRERQAMVQHIMNAHRQSRDAILSPKQVALLDRAHAYLAERRLERRHDRPRQGHRFQRLSSALELTAEQRQEWRALLERQRTTIHTLRESDEPLTRDDIRQLRLQHKEAFEAMLTPRQLAVFRDIEDRRHRRRADLDGTVDEFPELSDDPATSVGDKSWGEIKEESRQTGDAIGR